MTLDNLQIHHKRLNWLASGEFTERDFDYKIKKSDNPEGGIKHQGEGGWSTMGEFAGNKRKELIISKAKDSLARFEKNYPEFNNSKEKEVVPEKTIRGVKKDAK